MARADQFLARPGTVVDRLAGGMRYTSALGVARTRAPPVGYAVVPGSQSQEPTDLGMFDALSDRLRATLANLTGRGRVSEADVDAAMREVRLALLEADVNFKVVKDFVARVRERAIGADILESLTAGQQVVEDRQRGADRAPLGGRPDLPSPGQPGGHPARRPPGLGQDDDSSAKLARHVVKLGRRPLLVAADPYRPAAVDQLETLGRALDLPVHRAPAGTPVVDIARGGIEAARRQARDVVILDTAGRLSVDEALMREIATVAAAVAPVESLLVVDAMTGQEAVAVAEAFAAAVPLTGLILTKIDGDARGGAALSISAVTGCRSSSWAPARRPTRSSRSTPTAWPAASSAWATCSPSSSGPRMRSTRSRPPGCRRSWPRRASPSRTCSSRCSRSRRWAPSARSSA